MQPSRSQGDCHQGDCHQGDCHQGDCHQGDCHQIASLPCSPVFWFRLLGWGLGSLVCLMFTPVALGSTRSPQPSQPAASTRLLAQQVVDRLPPPPPIPDLQLPPASPVVPMGSGPTEDGEATGELYMVYVDGDSPLLLEQVQQVEPSATIQPFEGQTVILVGMFDRASAANQQIERLDERGIQADVAAVSRVVLTPSANPPADTSPPLPPADTLTALPPAMTANPVSDLPAVTVPSMTPASNPVPPPLVPEPVPPSVPLAQTATPSEGAYYVVIPGQTSTLGALQEQVMLLGAVPAAVTQRDRPIGPHLLIGPFVDQSAASRWNDFFRNFDMDSRVYYKR
ncbi:MAG: hypothetical protein VKJ64_07745 [Leptolyngbyaceae bacterium]|nr:hypothetical protein [Leptolyngbyaceae bacterium]